MIPQPKSGLTVPDTAASSASINETTSSNYRGDPEDHGEDEVIKVCHPNIQLKLLLSRILNASMKTNTRRCCLYNLGNEEDGSIGAWNQDQVHPWDTPLHIYLSQF
jgi:hypothetical protein